MELLVLPMTSRLPHPPRRLVPAAAARRWRVAVWVGWAWRPPRVATGPPRLLLLALLPRAAAPAPGAGGACACGGGAWGSGGAWRAGRWRRARGPSCEACGRPSPRGCTARSTAARSCPSCAEGPPETEGGGGEACKSEGEPWLLPSEGPWRSRVAGGLLLQGRLTRAWRVGRQVMCGVGGDGRHGW